MVNDNEINNISVNAAIAVGVTTFLSVLFLSPQGMPVLNGVFLCLMVIGLIIVMNSPELRQHIHKTSKKVLLSSQLYINQILSKEEKSPNSNDNKNNNNRSSLLSQEINQKTR